MASPLPMTRAAGLARLSDFLAGPGAAYAGARNTDRGPDVEPTTSALSPYLRGRLVTESEVAAAADGAFGDGGAGEFVSEVFWRTYFKGHLETHPTAWTVSWLAGSRRARAALTLLGRDGTVQGRTHGS